LSRIAKLAGIDSYAINKLSGCVADANAMTGLLARHADKKINFSCETIANEQVTRVGLRNAVESVFAVPNADVALFFFAGHGARRGSEEPYEGVLQTIDGQQGDEGVAMEWVIAQANQSKAKERVIILDCCYAGAFDQVLASRTPIPLKEGVSILAASRSNQTSAEVNGRGVFTSLICEALDGGAADVRGFVTTASIFAYADQLLTPFNQRPIFRTSVAGMRPLRHAEPQVSDEKLRELGVIFASLQSIKDLDPTYEPTIMPTHPENERVFKILQTCRDAGLVEVVDADSLYDAAIQSKGCRLTRLGHRYWNQVRKNLI
jgi:hypothetical protein